MKCDVVTLDNKKSGSVELDDMVFGIVVRKEILAKMVNYQLAKRRSGNHKTKTIGEIRGSTAKPWRQKGTGRARFGSRRATQWRGGQTVFGPVVRSHSHRLNKKVRKLALRSALSSKQLNGKLIIIEELSIPEPKTKTLAGQLEGLGLASALILGGDKVDPNFSLAVANIPQVDVLPQQGANVFDILRRDKLVLTKEAVKHLEGLLK